MITFEKRSASHRDSPPTVGCLGRPLACDPMALSRRLRAVGNVVDRLGGKRLGDLLIRVARMIVVAEKRVLNGWRWIDRHQPIVVVVAAAQIEYPDGVRDRSALHGLE